MPDSTSNVEQPLGTQPYASLRQEDRLSNETDAGTSSQTEGEVSLLQATRIPAGYHKLIRGKVEQDLDSELLLFTPCSLDNDVLLPDSAVTLQEDKLVTVVVRNHGRTAVRLPGGVRLGTVTPVDPISMVGEQETADKRDSSEETGVEAEGRVLWLDTGQDAPDSRVDKLFEAQVEVGSPDRGRTAKAQFHPHLIHGCIRPGFQ